MPTRLIALLTVAAAAALTLTVTAGAQQSYSDPVGDAGPGTDVTSISVRNDQAGAIAIQIASASPIVGNHAVAVFIDADKNAATGDDGTEAWMFGGPLVGAAFLNCSSAGCSETNPASFSARAAGPNITEFRFNRSDIGNSSGFNFAVISLSIDPPNLNFWDVAPNSGEYTYDLVFPQCSNGSDDDGDGTVDAQDLGCSSATDENEADEPVNIRVGAARIAPAAPRAGSMAVISALTTRVETGRPIDGGSARCTAAYPGRQLRVSGSVAAGRAVCRLRVPAAAKGKRIRGSLVVSYRGANATQTFAFRVR